MHELVMLCIQLAQRFDDVLLDSENVSLDLGWMLRNSTGNGRYGKLRTVVPGCRRLLGLLLNLILDKLLREGRNGVVAILCIVHVGLLVGRGDTEVT